MNDRPIVFVTHQFTRSGAPLCLLELARALLPLGQTVVVIGPSSGAILDEFRDAGARVVTIPWIERLYRGAHGRYSRIAYAPVRLGVNLILACRLALLFRSWRPSVVVLNSFAARFGALPARLSRTPLLWYLHEYGGKGVGGEIARQFVTKCADVLVANSHATLGWWNPTERCLQRVLYNGIQPSGRQPMPFDKREYDLLFVGRISPEKGFDVLLNAVAAIHAGGMKTSLVVVGEFESPAYRMAVELKEKALGIDSVCVHFPPQHDVREAMSRARILVLPSYREGFGRVLLEAMSCGTPVVASSVGGVPEAVLHGSTGLLVPPGNITALESAIMQILQDPKKHSAMATAARKFVEEKFSLVVFEESARNIIREVLR